MKKALIIVSILVGLVLIAMIVIPVFFKDDVKNAIDDAIASSLDADVVWESDDFSLSFFSNFPNLSAQLDNIGVVNRAPFEGEILFVTDEVEVEIDLFSLLGEQIRIIGINLEQPVINILVDEQGNANYDIAISEGDTPSKADSSGSYNVGIDHWRISNGILNYSDASIPLRASLRNIQHTGSGDFTKEAFDLLTRTTADSVMVSYDGTTYLSNKSVVLDAILNISDNFSKFTFKENSLAVNQFTIGVDGVFSMLEEGYRMDLTASAEDNSFKSLLSLVPGIYDEEFDRIRANGTLDFRAKVNGTYDENNIPAFELSLSTNNSMFQYPDLPTPVSGIDLDITIRNTDGILNNTSLDMPVFHAEFGSNPIDATLKVDNLEDYNMKGSLKASLNFSDITAIFPVEGMEIRGNGAADVSFEGRYDSASSIMPTVNGNLKISNAYIRSSDFPYALEKVNVTSSLENPTGNWKDFRMTIDPFNMQLDGAPFSANGEISNLDNYTWNIKAQGSVDLKKLSSVLRLKDVQIEGQMIADVQTKGNMAALEAERYADLPTSGDVTLRNFSYNSPDMPETFGISEASLTFDPARMNLIRFESRFGSSDFSINGSLSNYMGYVLDDEGVLKGNLTINSDKIDLNEFMTSDEAEASSSTEMGVIRIPKNVDFIAELKASEVYVTNMRMTDVNGSLGVRNQAAVLEKLAFNMLGGKVITNGSYSTVNQDHPAFDFSLDVNQVKLEETFNTFELVRVFAPVAGQMEGMISTEINLNGLLEDDMSPDLSTIDATGLLEIIRASLTDSKILQGISAVSSLNTGDDVNFENLLFNVTIQDGKLIVDPFKVNIKGYETEVMGTTSLDGSIAYELTMMVPAGNLGEKLNDFLASYTGGTDNDTIPVTIGIGGTYKDPQTVLLMDEQKELFENAIREKLTEEAGEKASDLLENVTDDKTKEILGNVLGVKKGDSVKTDSVKQQETKDEAVDKIKDFFRKRKSPEKQSEDSTNTQYDL